MKYSRVCHKCLFKSDREQEYCPECGGAKKEKFIDITIYSLVVNYFAKKFPNVDNVEIFVGYIINSLLLLLVIIIINPLLESSELLWIFFLLYSIQGIIKGISLRLYRFNKLHLISRSIIALYIGSGIGNLISHAGKPHDYYLSNFFYPNILLKELNSGNGLIIIGGLSAVIFIWIIRNLFNFLK